MLTSTASEETVQALAARVRETARAGGGLDIRGAGSKRFLGRRTDAPVLDMSVHAGVIAYEPTELVITARAGTRIEAVEALLAAHGQMLAFEPPDFGKGGTVGGMVASGLSGPRRPFVGAVRDFVLGVTVLDGRGEVLRFGGTVFKNVAGFDAFRLMAGAMGSLGALLDVSLRVIPKPRAERSLAFAEPWSKARARLTELMRQPLPLSGAMHDGQRLFVRLSGTERAVAHASAAIGGDDAPLEMWEALRHMRLPFFDASRLWRLSVPRTRAAGDVGGAALMDWAGGQMWLATEAPAEAVRAAAREVGGHATLFRGAADGEDVFDPLPGPLFDLHRRLKTALDPAGVFNRGRMYDGL